MDSLEKRAKKRRSWDEKIIAKMDDVSPLGRFPQNSEDMKANLSELERLRELFYGAEYRTRIKKEIVKINRR